MKKIIAITLLFISTFSCLKSSVFAHTSIFSATDISHDCSSEIFMNGAVSGPQTIPSINKTDEQDVISGPNAISPYMQKPVYDLIYNALRSYNTEQIYLTGYNIKYTQLYQYFASVLNDHPELFYVSTYIRYNSGEIINYVYFSYIYSKEQATQMLETYNQKAEYILSRAVSPEMTTEEKVLAVHDYLLLNCEYDYTNYLNNTLPNDAGNAYGVIVNHKGVCQSYALAMSDLLNRLGIPCINIGSYDMNHVWNLVNINGNWYHVDSTWDDSLFSGNPNRYDYRGYVAHTYFLLSDATISDATHQHTGWDPTLYPASTDTTYENLWSKDVRTGFLWHNGKFYCGYSGYIYEYDLPSNKPIQFYNTGNNARNYIAIWGNWLYFTSANLGTVSRINLDTKEVSLIDTYPYDELYINDGKLIYSDWETDTIKEKPLSELNKEQYLTGNPIFTNMSGQYLPFSTLPLDSNINITIAISNLTVSQPADLMLAFYQRDKLISCKKINDTIQGLDGIYKDVIKTPSTSFDRISVFLWKSDQAVPYSVSLNMLQR